MSKDPFLLVSLEENESKALAQVMSNDSARKILDYLSKNDGAVTETDLSKKLKVPLSTVHYNLQALVKANLVVTEEFHYSEKGKEVLHYSLANKIIIIAQKKTSTDSFRDKLRSILPIGLITLVTAGVIHFISNFGFSSSAKLGRIAQESALNTLSADAAPMMVKAAVEDASAGAQAASQAMPYLSDGISQSPNYALWFLAGGLFVLLLLVIWFYWTRKK